MSTQPRFDYNGLPRIRNKEFLTENDVKGKIIRINTIDDIKKIPPSAITDPTMLSIASMKGMTQSHIDSLPNAIQHIQIKSEQREKFNNDHLSKYRMVVDDDNRAFEYTEDESESAHIYKREELKQIVTQIEGVEKDTENLSKFDKFITFYDRLLRNIDYDQRHEGKSSYDTRSLRGLITHNTVCAGYATILQTICERNDITCHYVSGRSGSAGHAWNLVEIDGEKFNVDLTWDSGRYCNGISPSRLYEWIGKDTNDFNKRHVLRPFFKNNDYYTKNVVSIEKSSISFQKAIEKRWKKINESTQRILESIINEKDIKAVKSRFYAYFNSVGTDFDLSYKNMILMIEVDEKIQSLSNDVNKGLRRALFADLTGVAGKQKLECDTICLYQNQSSDYKSISNAQRKDVLKKLDKFQNEQFKITQVPRKISPTMPQFEPLKLIKKTDAEIATEESMHHGYGDRTYKACEYYIENADGSKQDIWNMSSDVLLNRLIGALQIQDKNEKTKEINKIKTICENMGKHLKLSYHNLAQIDYINNDYQQSLMNSKNSEEYAKNACEIMKLLTTGKEYREKCAESNYICRYKTLTAGNYECSLLDRVRVFEELYMIRGKGSVRGKQPQGISPTPQPQGTPTTPQGPVSRPAVPPTPQPQGTQQNPQGKQQTPIHHGASVSFANLDSKIDFLNKLTLVPKTKNDFAQELSGKSGVTREDLSCCYAVVNNAKRNVTDLTYKEIEKTLFEIVNIPDYNEVSRLYVKYSDVLRKANYSPSYGTLARILLEQDKIQASNLANKGARADLLRNFGTNTLDTSKIICKYIKVKNSDFSSVNKSEQSKVLLQMQKNYDTFAFTPPTTTSQIFKKLIDTTKVPKSNDIKLYQKTDQEIKQEASMNSSAYHNVAAKVCPFTIADVNGGKQDIWNLKANDVIGQLTVAIVSGDNNEIRKMRIICENMKGHFNPSYGEMARLTKVINDFWQLNNNPDIDRAIDALKGMAMQKYSEGYAIAQFNAQNAGRPRPTYTDMVDVFNELEKQNNLLKQNQVQGMTI